MTTAKLTPQQSKAVRKIHNALADHPTGVSFSELMQITQYKQSSLYNALALARAKKDEHGMWYLPSHDDEAATTQNKIIPQDTPAPHVNPSAEVVNPSVSDIDTDTDQSSNGQATEAAPVADDSEIVEEIAEVNQATAKQKRNKPFAPNLTRGYEVQRDKVKIFLDRKASSKVLTLTLADLKELVNAVEKSERVA